MNWKKIILLILASVVASVVLLAIVGVMAVKRSVWVRPQILAKAERSIGTSTGAEVGIHDFRFDLFPLRLELEGIVARGRGPQSAPPLLQVEHLTADIKLDSGFNPRWRLQTCRYHHPSFP